MLKTDMGVFSLETRTPGRRRMKPSLLGLHGCLSPADNGARTLLFLHPFSGFP